MTDFIRCERQRVGKFAAIGLFFVLVPAVGGIAILILLPPGMITWTGATVCLLIAFIFAYPTLRMFQWVETDGRLIRGKRFWTRLTVVRSINELAEMQVGLGQLADQGRDPALGSIRAFNYQLFFRDRTFVYLSCFDMVNLEPFIERLMIEPGTALAMPLCLGAARLGGLVNYGEPELGRAYAYYLPGHVAITVYIYRKSEPLAGGIESAGVLEEFEKVKSVMSEIRGDSGADGEARGPHLTTSTVTLGEEPGAPPALCASIEVEAEGELLESRLYLTVWRGHFIKLRCMMPATYRSTWGPGLSRFEAALGAMLR